MLPVGLGRGCGVGLFMLVFFVASVVALIFGPEWLVTRTLSRHGTQAQIGQIAPERYVDMVDNARKTVAQSIAGLALFGTLWLTFVTIRSNEKGKIADRFAKALDHLGAMRAPADKVASEVRIGGVAELELIGDESTKERKLIKHCLVAYVRSYAWWGARQSGVPVWQRKEVQTVVATLAKWGIELGERDELRLDDIDLRHVRLSKGARLTNLIANRTHFEHAQLQGVVFEGANLDRSCFSGAKLQNADFRRASLIGVRFSGQRAGQDAWGWNNDERKFGWNVPSPDADITGADFRGADLTGAAISDEQIGSAMTNDETILPSRESEGRAD
jgi:Pentapeptide repeats (8 copies)